MNSIALLFLSSKKKKKIIVVGNMKHSNLYKDTYKSIWEPFDYFAEEDGFIDLTLVQASNLCLKSNYTIGNPNDYVIEKY